MKKKEMPDIKTEEERIHKSIEKLNKERVEIALKLKTELEVSWWKIILTLSARKINNQDSFYLLRNVLKYQRTECW